MSKSLLIISSLLATLAVVSIYKHHISQEEDLYQLYTSWKSRFDMTFDEEEDNFRFAVFCENYAIIRQHNSEGHSWIMAINQFTALTPVEFTEKLNLGKPLGPAIEGVQDQLCPSAVNCPTLENTTVTSVNWTQAGAVTPVQNEAGCSSGWAFSATGALEGLYFLNTSNLTEFSVQQILDCTPNCYSCQGGWPYLALEYTASAGIETWNDYPYIAQPENCHYRVNKSIQVNTGYQCIQQGNNTQMMAALAMRPVSIAVEANQPVWQYYGGGVIPGLCGDQLDLGILLVGYENVAGMNTWILKNNWGLTWGDNGYAYLLDDPTQNGGMGVCGLLRCGTLAINANATSQETIYA